MAVVVVVVIVVVTRLLSHNEKERIDNYERIRTKHSIQFLFPFYLIFLLHFVVVYCWNTKKKTDRQTDRPRENETDIKLRLLRPDCRRHRPTNRPRIATINWHLFIGEKHFHHRRRHSFNSQLDASFYLFTYLLYLFIYWLLALCQYCDEMQSDIVRWCYNLCVWVVGWLYNRVHVSYYIIHVSIRSQCSSLYNDAISLIS